MRRPRFTGPTPAVQKIVKARSGGVCEFTGCTDAGGHIHHRRPRRMGGSKAPETNGVANLLHLCCGHHDWVESNRAAAIVKGLLLYATADPGGALVWTRHSDGPIFLTPDGGWVRYEEACA